LLRFARNDGFLWRLGHLAADHHIADTISTQLRRLKV
jgi:hypothetical protein